ncbi:hypothetical protein TNCV_89141 [Trichonephila clavipes]|nr:hypothetical protein TNCV_89141 [Trichonephila clavipes]
MSCDRHCRVVDSSPGATEDSSCSALNLLRLKDLALACCGSLESDVSVQMSSSSLNRSSKLRGPSPVV